jgi:hypothetical protein
MKNQMILFTTWLNANPHRVRTISFALMVALMLALAIAPGVAVAGDAVSGS